MSGSGQVYIPPKPDESSNGSGVSLSQVNALISSAIPADAMAYNYLSTYNPGNLVSYTGQSMYPLTVVPTTFVSTVHNTIGTLMRFTTAGNITCLSMCLASAGTYAMSIWKASSTGTASVKVATANITKSSPGWATTRLATPYTLDPDLTSLYIVCYDTGGLNWSQMTAGLPNPFSQVQSNIAIVPLGTRFNAGDNNNLFTSYSDISENYYTDVVLEPTKTPVLTIYKAIATTSAIPSQLTDWSYVDIDFDKNNPPVSASTANTLVARNGLGGINASGVLDMNYQAKNKIIVLNGDSTNVNATDHYGLGVNSATLRYNVPTFATHRFYVNTTDVLDVNDTNGMLLNVGNLSISAGSLFLPTTGGIKSALNYYEEYILPSASITGGSTAVAVNIKFARIGSTVHMTVPAVGAGTVSTILSLATAIPSRFRPGNDKQIPIIVIKNTTDIFGSCYILTGGVFNVYPGLTTDTWGSVAGGFPSFTTSWNI